MSDPAKEGPHGDAESTWTREAAERQAEELERLRTGHGPSAPVEQDPTMGPVVLDPNAPTGTDQPEHPRNDGSNPEVSDPEKSVVGRFPTREEVLERRRNCGDGPW